ncbi:excinuclease ABC subunit C [Kosmotoga arenicorallina S304]|uniref:UvrABC system protein C n=1 Tax=Kosmotoga arenicorallina S304 TaxID=1453497 RepID=A0A176K0W3_9BACT|nr:excinuclease ABC subunit UvrC [Kosmotoga arenicorallina]OAA30110.1 excinuclease ABC subunit C [Kosmotoga arenicorallina S304]
MKRALQNKISSLPETCGVYIFKNSEGKIIYIGKAVKLKRRVQSYFRESSWKDEKVRKIAEESSDMDFIIVPSEREALLLEANLIYKYKPRYNILLKESRFYPYIYISRDEFPYVELRRDRKAPGMYFGPYTSTRLVRSILELLQRIFKVRSCKQSLDRIKKACFLYHLKMCSAPCVGKITKEEYKKSLDNFIEFLEGNTLSVRTSLEERMYRLADNLQFEQAKEIRDVLDSMDKLYSRQAVDVPQDLSIDVLALSSGILVLLEIRGGMLLGKLVYDFPEGKVSDFISQFYLAREKHRPKSLIVSGLRKTETNMFKSEFEYIGKPRTEFESRLMKIAFQNIEQELNIRIGAVETLKQTRNILGLKKIPRFIEGIDISHTQGLMTVASLVVFESGKPDKSRYRRYRIRNLEVPNDFEALATVIKRRYSKHPLPDLLFIDGGFPQLRAVSEALEELNLKTEIVGIAKEEEEIVFPDSRGKLKLPPDHPVMKLLVSIRDETHRFAVNYHRYLRERRFVSSEIDGIPGIGPKRKRLLMKHFKSVSRIKKASEEELCKVIKNKKIVAEILKWAKENGG